MRKEYNAKWCVIGGSPHRCWSGNTEIDLYLYKSLEPDEIDENTIEDATIVIEIDDDKHSLFISGKKYDVIEIEKKTTVKNKIGGDFKYITGDGEVSQEYANSFKDEFVTKDGDVYEKEVKDSFFSRKRKAIFIKSGKYLYKNPVFKRMKWTNKRVQYVEDYTL